MMCHGPFDSLFRLVEETLEENRSRRYEGSEQYRLPGIERPAELELELERMYARGEIDRDTFLRVRPLARRGELAWADLDGLRRATPPRLWPQGVLASESEAALASIRGKKAALEQARRESETVVQSLEERIAGLAQEASRLEQQAREVLPQDEEQARARLLRKHDFLEQSRTLQERLQSLRQDMRRLEDLEVELDVKEQELKVLQARERLGTLENEIKGSRLGLQKSRHT